MGDLGPSGGHRGYMRPTKPRKKSRSAGPGPVDRISDEDRSGTRRQRDDGSKLRSPSNGGPSRYTDRRYRSARELNAGDLLANSTGPDREQLCGKGEELGRIPGRSAAVGLLESTEGAYAAVVKYSISGTLSTLDVCGDTNYESQCVLDFFTDSTGPRVQFTLDRMENKDTQIDICRDCAGILVDESYTCLGFILLEARGLQLRARYKVGAGKSGDVLPTTALQFVSNDTNKIKRVQENLKGSSKGQVCILPTKEDLEKELRALGSIEQESIQESPTDTANEARSKFPHKERFPSIERWRARSHSRSSSGSVCRVVVPSSPERVHMPGVSPNAFYSRKGSLQKHAFSNLDIIRQTRSKAPNLAQSKLWNLDDEGEREIPERFEPQLCYKFDDGASYTITNQDFKCLYNHDWINDTILDFFTKYYVEKAVRNSVVTPEEVYIMSSFFYTKLISDPTDYYGNIKKWVNNSNLFQKKYVVVPININFHWFGCIITNLDSLKSFFERLNDSEKAKLSSKIAYTGTVTKSPRPSPDARAADISHFSSRNNTPSATEEDDEEVSVSAPIVKILTFDSLRQTHSREIDPLKDFLIAYAKDKYSIDLDKSLIKMRTCAVPQQPNMSDCGVHVILNTMKFFENPQGTIEIWRSAKSRSKANTKTINEYFERNKRSSARRDLRGILWHLQKEQIKLMEENREAREDNSDIHKEEEEGDLEIIEELSKHAEAQSHQNSQSADRPNEYNLHQLMQTESPCATKASIECFSGTTDSQHSPETGNRVQANEMPSASHVRNQIEGDSVKGRQSLSQSLSQRKYLESSPMRSSNEDTLPETTSPYFTTSGWRSGQAARDNENNKRLVSSRSLERLDNHEAKRRSFPSPGPLEKPDLDEESSSSLAIGTGTRDSQSSESSLGNGDMVSLSDNTHDDDVNLIGRDTLTQVQRNLASELNGRVSDEGIPVSRSLSDAPLLARNSVITHPLKERWPNGSDSDLVDELSTRHQIEMITSD
ncbi:hypothetical protein HG536_0C04450 [Torulaspora globosa]|uniref:Ubiquitin-like protease family profile domain-containing protein n=1 Tax=Torulaspora globosa TaxID=48254 RepID=A0A7G3ZFJ0_9SACH|nr:uncharacterized protein HG536_0C04450 [Torulaspora globosa]QLL32276.1 hypothetical protein HG536_0C04450 [Torulaspora globosa]